MIIIINPRCNPLLYFAVGSQTSIQILHEFLNQLKKVLRHGSGAQVGTLMKKMKVKNHALLSL
jgi:carbamate kinase